MTESDGQLRDALRDLIPGYTGPADPLPRVVASVRRRRTRQRVLLAVAGTGTAAAVVLAGPALLLPTGAVTGAGSAPPVPAVPAPTASGLPGLPAADPPVFPVNSGTVAGAAWATGSVRLASGARRCLRSDDALGTAEVLCFDFWKGAGASWAAVGSQPGAVPATRVVGVAAPAASWVRIAFADGAETTVAAVATPVDRTADFFAAAFSGTRTVRSVTLLDAARMPLGPALTDPGHDPCRPRHDAACAAPR